MAVSIGSNISSLKAQRALADSSARTEKLFRKLSSGQRIGGAVDDPAGLAISTALNVDSRVFSQGIRNLNDGVSALNIAASAYTEIKSATIRIKELATQSASGSYSDTQRQALDSEAQSLREEINRIRQTTEFNGISLLDGSSSQIAIQAGGNRGGPLFINFESTGSSTTGVGDGTFDAANTLITSNGVEEAATGDINGDGNLDIISISSTFNAAYVQLLGR